MTPRENLRRAMEESFARQWGGRWSVGLADDEPAQRDLVDGDHVPVEDGGALGDGLTPPASLADDDRSVDER